MRTIFWSVFGVGSLIVIGVMAAQGGDRTVSSAAGAIVGALGILFVIGVSFVIYFAPLLVASHRRHPNGMAIAVLNLFLGWTFLGWVVALAWSFTAVPAPPAPPPRRPRTINDDEDPAVEDWQRQQVELSPQRAEWAANAGKRTS